MTAVQPNRIGRRSLLRNSCFATHSTSKPCKSLFAAPKMDWLEIRTPNSSDSLATKLHGRSLTGLKDARGSIHMSLVPAARRILASLRFRTNFQALLPMAQAKNRRGASRLLMILIPYLESTTSVRLC